MCVKWGQKQWRLRKTTILDIRTYPCKLNIGDEQEIVLVEDDDGPFNMKPHVRRKNYDLFTVETKIAEKIKKKLTKSLKEKQFIVRDHYNKDKFHKLAVDYDISLTFQVDIIEPG